MDRASPGNSGRFRRCGDQISPLQRVNHSRSFYDGDAQTHWPQFDDPAQADEVRHMQDMGKKKDFQSPRPRGRSSTNTRARPATPDRSGYPSAARLWSGIRRACQQEVHSPRRYWRVLGSQIPVLANWANLLRYHLIKCVSLDDCPSRNAVRTYHSECTNALCK